MIDVEVKNKLKKNLLDDRFLNQEQRDDLKLEKVREINISDIDDFPNHPFKVIINDDMKNMIESIKEYGILSPVLVRPKKDGRYEMISGHRRKFASIYAKLEKIPCIVRELTDDEAIIIMVDSNLQREELLPSEKAFAYKMKYDAIKHQGKTSGQVDQKWSAELLGKEVGESEKTVRRYINLTNLRPKLLDMVDKKIIALSPAFELSYLKDEEQDVLLDFISYNQSTPSLEQAIKLKKLSQSGILDVDTINKIMGELKPNQRPKLQFDRRRLKSVLPKNLEESKIEDYVIKSVEYYTKYLKHKNRDNRDSR